MSQVVLTQHGGSFPAGPGIDFNCSMTDQNNNGQSVDVNEPASMIKFNGYGPSTGTMSNIVLTGNPPAKMTFNVSGTGNLPGKDNASYTGSGSWVIGWSYNEVTHHYTAYGVDGSVTLNY